MSTTALVLAFAVSDQAPDGVLIAFVPAAALESIFGYCLGCKAFALRMRVGVVPESVCEECADIRGRVSAAATR